MHLARTAPDGVHIFLLFNIVSLSHENVSMSLQFNCETFCRCIHFRSTMFWPTNSASEFLRISVVKECSVFETILCCWLLLSSCIMFIVANCLVAWLVRVHNINDDYVMKHTCSNQPKCSRITTSSMFYKRLC